MKVCFKAEDVKQENGYVSVRTNCVEIRVLFLTDSIVRIRAGFDGDFAEESYSLVMTGWEDRMDGFLEGKRKRVQLAQALLEDGEEKAIIRGKELRVEIEKNPFRIVCMMQRTHCCMLILWIWLIWKTAITAESIPVKLHRRTASMDSEKRAENLTRHRSL